MIFQPKLEVSEARKLLRRALRTDFTSKLNEFNFHHAADLTKQGGGYAKTFCPIGYWKRENENGSLTTICVQMNKYHRPSFSVNFEKWQTDNPEQALRKPMKLRNKEGDWGWEHWEVAERGRMIPRRYLSLQPWFSATWPYRRSEKRIAQIVNKAASVVPELVAWSENGTRHHLLDLDRGKAG